MGVGFSPGEVYVGLFSRKSSKLVDFRHFRRGGGGTYEADDIEFERTTGEEVEALIRGGENREVEFKLKVGGGPDLAETVVAFANSNGGTILLGVDDSGNVVGCDQGRHASLAHLATDAVRTAHLFNGRARLVKSAASTTGC